MTGVELIARERQRQIENDNSCAWYRDIFKTKISGRIDAYYQAMNPAKLAINQTGGNSKHGSNNNGIDHDIAERKARDASEINPLHYSRWKIEPLDSITANNLDFLWRK